MFTARNIGLQVKFSQFAITNRMNMEFCHSHNNKQHQRFPKEFKTVGMNSRHTTTTEVLSNLAKNDINPTTSNQDNNGERPEATGTVQSIVGWGKSVQLSPQLEEVFHMLCAVHVLTFCNEAMLVPDTDSTHFKQQKKTLKKLSQETESSFHPRISVSLSVGSGKSEFVLNLSRAVLH